jgi:class I fructose-bisphosphate aldolase
LTLALRRDAVGCGDLSPNTVPCDKKGGSGVCPKVAPTSCQEGTADGNLRTGQADPQLLRERQSGHQGEPRTHPVAGQARRLALDAGLSAYAAPLGFLEAGADTFAGRIPTQAITGNVKDALRLGCAAIGYTIYPGSDAAYDQMRDIAEMACEAKSYGLAVVIWSYPRGGDLSRKGETAIDISAYAAQIAAQLGAHIIKVKPPTAHLELAAAKAVYEKQGIDISTPAARIRHVVQSAFSGRRIVVFSGGEAKDLDGVFAEVRAVRDGGGNGSIIGRNTFQRKKDDALSMLDKIIKIHQGKD